MQMIPSVGLWDLPQLKPLVVGADENPFFSPSQGFQEADKKDKISKITCVETSQVQGEGTSLVVGNTWEIVGAELRSEG